MDLQDIRQKIRALVEDFGTRCNSPEVFSYEGSNIFTICVGVVNSIIKVTNNDVELGSGEYSFDSTTNELTILSVLATDDIIKVYYTCNVYSDTELDEYIRASLVWLSIYSYCSGEDFEIETDDIYPTPTNKERDLISLISSILIKPNYSMYKMPTVTITYPRTMSKEDRIEVMITHFKRGLGVNELIEFNYW